MPLFQCPSRRCDINKTKGNLILQLRASKFLKFQEVYTLFWFTHKSCDNKEGICIVYAIHSYIMLVHFFNYSVYHLLNIGCVFIAGQDTRVGWTCSKRPYSSNNDCSLQGRTHKKGWLFYQFHKMNLRVNFFFFALWRPKKNTSSF